MDIESKMSGLSIDDGSESVKHEEENECSLPGPFPMKQYQCDITTTALSNDTLICLPSGGGKGVIGALVIKQFQQQYPKGLNIFISSTGSCVTQRFHTYRQIMDGQVNEATILTGDSKGINRKDVWKSKRVIFTNPHILHNHLSKSNVPESKIKCIVMDDINRAVGVDVRAKIIQDVHKYNRNIRLVGLCQIPGNEEKDVINLMKQFHISHLECRDENSPDYNGYMKQRKIKEIIVQPPCNNLLKQYNNIMGPYQKILFDNGILDTIDQHLSNEWLLKKRAIYMSSNRGKTNQENVIRAFDILIKMMVGYQKMNRQGLRSLLFYFQRDASKGVVDDIPQLNDFIKDIEEKLGDYPDVLKLINDSTMEMNKMYKFGHGKFEILGRELVQHFRDNENGNTRALVLSESKEIVLEIYLYLCQFHENLNPQVFLGDHTMKLKQRDNALAAFNTNQNRVLIATQKIEEEGKFGDVDLIICFDLFDPTPTRLIQRLNFAHKSEIGHLTFLLTEYGEKETLTKARDKMTALFDKIRGTFVTKGEIRENIDSERSNDAAPVEASKGKKGKGKKKSEKPKRRPLKK